jgi:all-trans-8'-apo-beta-carotenal 15,15'-oxygenase
VPAVPGSSSADSAPRLEALFRIEPREGSFEPTVEGDLPARLSGRYYLNGPALFRRGDLVYRHWLDGDGLVTTLRFGGGRVRGTHRFVGSTKHAEEERAGRPIYRAFGTSFAGDRLRRGLGIESPANVSAYTWAGVLLAYGEQALPWELDPDDLTTRGEYRFGDRLNVLSPLSAHPAFDRRRGEMFNFGISYAARAPLLHLYRFAGCELDERWRVPLPFPCTVHDFGLSPNFAIFHLGPYLMDVERLLGGGGSVVDCLEWKPERGAVLLLIDRATGARRAALEMPGRYCLHLANAFEEGGEVVVDFLELDRPVYDQYQPLPDLFKDAPPGRPVRLRVDPRSGRLLERRALDYDSTPDFPSIDWRRALEPARDCWVLGISAAKKPGRKFFDELVHLDWNAGSPQAIYRSPRGRYLGGEPAFLPDPDDEHGGWVICQEIDPTGDEVRSDFLLFDAHAIGEGPRARLRLPRPIPPGFHASFLPG